MKGGVIMTLHINITWVEILLYIIIFWIGRVIGYFDKK